MAGNTVEGPRIQSGFRGYPSFWKQVSERTSKLKVWELKLMNVHIFCYSFAVLFCFVVERGLFATHQEGESVFTFVNSECKMNQ